MRTFFLYYRPLDRIFRADQILNVRVIVRDILNMFDKVNLYKKHNL